MPTYRAYLLNPAGRIMTALDVEAESPAAALEQALAGGHPHAVEVWRGPELLARGEAGARRTGS